VIVRRQFLLFAAGLAAMSIAESAIADSTLADSITPSLMVGFEFGAPPAPTAASRVTASFNINSRVMRPTLSAIASSSQEIQEDVLLAGRGITWMTLFDFSATPAGIEGAHAIGHSLLPKRRANP
jgi:hypothetical protein